MAATYRPIESPLGTLNGRDCIFLRGVSLLEHQNDLVLRCSVDEGLCSKGRSDVVAGVPTTMTFRGVLALLMIELDSWDWSGESSFDEVVDSEWVRTLRGKVTSAHRHFVVQTYDNVFQVVCEDYVVTMDLDTSDSRGPQEIRREAEEPGSTQR